jgi:hypothetical protein
MMCWRFPTRPTSFEGGARVMEVGDVEGEKVGGWTASGLFEGH